MERFKGECNDSILKSGMMMVVPLIELGHLEKEIGLEFGMMLILSPLLKLVHLFQPSLY